MHEVCLDGMPMKKEIQHAVVHACDSVTMMNCLSHRFKLLTQLRLSPDLLPAAFLLEQ